MKKMLANVAMAMVLAMGMVVNAEASNFDDTVFGQSVYETIAKSNTCKMVNLGGIRENEIVLMDTKVDPVLGLPIELMKYAFMNDALYNTEVNFKESNLENFDILLKKLTKKYGKGKLLGSYKEVNGRTDIGCSWKFNDKFIVLYYLEEKADGYKSLALNVAGKAGVRASLTSTTTAELLSHTEGVSI